MAWDILIKPAFENGGGGFVFSEPGTVTVYDADGNVIDTGKTGSKGDAGYKVQSSVIARGGGAYFTFNGQRYEITQPGMRHEFNFGSSKPTKVSSKGAVGSGGGGAGGIGTAGTGPGYAFPQGDFSTLKDIPRFQVPKVDPIKRTREVGDFNTGQFQDAFDIGFGNAKELIKLEFDQLAGYNRAARGLQREGVSEENTFNFGETSRGNTVDRGETLRAIEFNRSNIPASNELNRGEVSKANAFNQKERLAQLEKALPGSRDVLLRQIERGATMAEGRFTSDLEDRAFEMAARSSGADIANSRGFGDDSVFGRRTSDLLSAQQRLDLSQVGEQTIDRFTSLAGNLAFDQPIKQNPVLDQPLQFTPQRTQPQQTRTAQDVRGAPVRPASELATNQQSQLLPLTTIPPNAAIGFDVNQNQFQGNLDRDADKFNSGLELERIYGGIFNAQQEAGAINAGIDQGIATDRFEAGQNAAENAANMGAVGNIIGGGLSWIASGGLGNIFGLGGGTGGIGVAGGGVGGGAGVLGLGGGGGAGVGGTGLGTSGVTGGGTSLTSMGSLGTPLAIVAAAVATGRGIYETVQGLTDGSITEKDVKRGLATIGGPSAAATQGINDILGKPINGNDLSNALLLSNPATAPLAIADMIGIGGSGKGKEQQKRDALRDLGLNLNVFTKPNDDMANQSGLDKEAHYLQLKDGSYYNIGIDGENKLENYGTNIDGKAERNTFDVDWSDPRAAQTVAWMNPVNFMLFGENYQAMMGHTTNAVMSNNRSLADTKENARYMAEQAGIDYQTGLQVMKQYKNRGVISESDYLAFVGGWNDLMLNNGVANEVAV